MGTCVTSRDNNAACRLFRRDYCRLLLGELSEKKIKEGSRLGPARGAAVGQADKEY